MNLEKFHEYCLSKQGVTEHVPFDNDTLVFKVGGKIFALSSLIKWEEGQPAVNLKCNPEFAEELRAQYDAITAGFHMNKKHWNTVVINKEVNDQMLEELIKHSYDLVFRSLPKIAQKNIENLELPFVDTYCRFNYYYDSHGE